LLVGDDGSSDATVSILEAFARTAPFPVEVAVNETRLGYASNLERLLGRAKGDLIFPCDQDDLWHPDKIEVLTGVMAQRPEAGAAIADSALIDDRGRAVGGTLFGRVGCDDRTRRVLETASSTAFCEIAERNVVASHALVIRRSALGLVLPFGATAHADWWIALVLSATTGIVVDDRTLVDYRLHDANAVGLRTHRPIGERLTPVGTERFTKRADLLESAMLRLAQISKGVPSAEDRQRLEAQIQHLRTRAGLRGQLVGRLPVVLGELRSGRYRTYSNGWRSAVSDLIRSPR
jgi:glycosyltransferase involved in cell wall biosynthesis